MDVSLININKIFKLNILNLTNKAIWKKLQKYQQLKMILKFEKLFFIIKRIIFVKYKIFIIYKIIE